MKPARRAAAWPAAEASEQVRKSTTPATKSSQWPGRWPLSPNPTWTRRWLAAAQQQVTAWEPAVTKEQLFPFCTRDLISSQWCYSWVNKTNIDPSSTVQVNSPIVVMS